MFHHACTACRYAKAVDVSRLDTTLTERCSRLEEEVENLRQGVRTAIESGGGSSGRVRWLYTG
jgi:hypothetical protein